LGWALSERHDRAPCQWPRGGGWQLARPSCHRDSDPGPCPRRRAGLPVANCGGDPNMNGL
jgi:hypothetical protein